MDPLLFTALAILSYSNVCNTFLAIFFAIHSLNSPIQTVLFLDVSKTCAIFRFRFSLTRAGVYEGDRGKQKMASKLLIELTFLASSVLFFFFFFFLSLSFAQCFVFLFVCCCFFKINTGFFFGLTELVNNECDIPIVWARQLSHPRTRQ